MATLATFGLTKFYGDQAAVDGLSFHAPERSITGFLGANGAGKTTTLRLALGLLRPDAGHVELFGRRMRRGGAEGVGALIETPSLYPHLTGRENLDLSRRIIGLPSDEIGRVLDVVGLTKVGTKRVGGYSLGMRQRLAIARALLGRPRLLILDEPTNGLDPEGILDMRALLKRLADEEGTTLLVSSHLLAEVEQVATHVAMIHRGRLLVEGSLLDLLCKAPLIEVETADLVASAKFLRGAGFAVEVETRRLSVGGGAREADPGTIAQMLIAQGHALTHLSKRRNTLEGLYHKQLALAA